MKCEHVHQKISMWHFSYTCCRRFASKIFFRNFLGYTTPEFRCHNSLSSDVVHPQPQSVTLLQLEFFECPTDLTQPEFFHSDYGRKLWTWSNLCPIAETLAAVSSAMEHCDFSSKEAINSALKTLAITLNIPYRKLMLLCRLAVTGTTVSNWSWYIIGASLSESHTSVTALCTCVCMYVCLSVCLRPYTENFK